MDERCGWTLILAAALVAEVMPAWAGQTIPFSEALDNAAVSVERLDDILEYGLLIGNGDINALVYTDAGNIEMVLTKNDVGEARLDTALDPPLPTLKRIKELSRGAWPNREVILPEGVTWKGPDSYHAHPYPCPRARWLARKIFDMDGVFYPHVLFAYEPPDPSKVNSPAGRQYIHHVWGLTLGVAGFTVQPLWWHYKCEQDRQFLEQTAYPAVRDVAVFCANFIDQCERRDSRVVLSPSVSPEHWGWTANFERKRDCTFDIAMARHTLRAAIEGATTLERDPDLVTRFRAALDLLPDYPRTRAEDPVVVDVEDAPPINYNIVVPTTPVFPGDLITWQSSADQCELLAENRRARLFREPAAAADAGRPGHRAGVYPSRRQVDLCRG